MKLKNKKILIKLMLLPLALVPIASILASCNSNKTKYKIEVLKHVFKTKNNGYYIAYQFDDLSTNDKTKLEKVSFSSSIINQLNQRIAFNVDTKAIIKDNKIYIRLPQQPQANQKIIVNSSHDFIAVRIINTNDLIMEFVDLELKEQNPQPQPQPIPQPTPKPTNPKLDPQPTPIPPIVEPEPIWNPIINDLTTKQENNDLNNQTLKANIKFEDHTFLIDKEQIANINELSKAFYFEFTKKDSSEKISFSGNEANEMININDIKTNNEKLFLSQFSLNFLLSKIPQHKQGIYHLSKLTFNNQEINLEDRIRNKEINLIAKTNPTLPQKEDLIVLSDN
ncbi:MBA family surface membrane protein [Ureaplasma urealyticum]|uniref:MBA family surface membrane protein n=1 Tax=Ureaplasma urealyticum TaxID=2130 RepID=UPI001F60719C|nr:hypothetical protein [Ureaplasma urealyticum]